jgi:hypothetical protein
MRMTITNITCTYHLRSQLQLAKAVNLSITYVTLPLPSIPRSLLFIRPGLHFPDSKSWNIPEVVLVRRWAVGVLGILREGVGWVKGGANGVSLQAT